MNDTSVTVIQPHRGLPRLELMEIWRYRDLLKMLIWRDIFGKYRQSVLGFTWAFIPPLMMMAAFTIIFGGGADIADLGPEDDSVKYQLFSFSALLPWWYFTRALQSAGNSVLSGGGLISKVYFPRLILPLTGVLGGLVDFLIGFVVLGILLLYYGVTPTPAILLLPVFVGIAGLTAFGVGLWLTALSVRYRDVAFVTPFLLQIWMLATPIIFAVERIPDRYQIFVWLNPMTGVVEGFRWAILGTNPPVWHLMAISLSIILLLLVSGLWVFRALEKTFADII